MNKLADCEPQASSTSWAAHKPPSIAMQRIQRKIEVQAKRAVRLAIKDRARAYALRPRELDAIAEGFFSLQPKDLVCLLNATCIHWGPGDWRWYGYTGVPPLNLRGAMLYARWSRAKQAQMNNVARNRPFSVPFHD